MASKKELDMGILHDQNSEKYKKDLAEGLKSFFKKKLTETSTFTPTSCGDVDHICEIGDFAPEQQRLRHKDFVNNRRDYSTKATSSSSSHSFYICDVDKAFEPYCFSDEMDELLMKTLLCRADVRCVKEGERDKEGLPLLWMYGWLGLSELELIDETFSRVFKKWEIFDKVDPDTVEKVKQLVDGVQDKGESLPVELREIGTRNLKFIDENIETENLSDRQVIGYTPPNSIKNFFHKADIRYEEIKSEIEGVSAEEQYPDWFR